jgi:hypothetical protein
MKTKHRIISVMKVLLSNMYYSSSSECTKIRIDRYHANVGPNNDQQLLIKILQWIDKPILNVDKNKTYIAELRFSINMSKNGESFTNHDIIYIGEYYANEPVSCLYTFILNKVHKSSPNEQINTVVVNQPVIDDLPF